MTPDARPDQSQSSPAALAGRALRPRVLPWVVLACTLLSTFSVAYYVWSKDRLRADYAAREAARSARHRIQARLDSYDLLLRGAAGVIANRLPEGADRIPAHRDEFATYVDRLELHENYPGIQGLGFALRLRADERGPFEQAMRREGVEQFRVWSDADAATAPAAAAAAEDVVPIVYLEPLDERNGAALGYDMLSESVRREAMERARDTAAPAATGVVRLKQEIDDRDRQNGFLIYLPVYHTGKAPADLRARRAELAGFVYAPFRARDLLDGIFQSGAPIEFSVYDGERLLDRTDEAGAAAGTAAADPSLDTAPANVDRTIHLGGRQWTLRFRPHPHPELSFRPMVVPAIVVCGGALSLLLFLLTHSEGRARLEAERAADELRQSRAALERANASLRESEARLRTFIDANIVGMLIADVSGRVHEANDAFLRIVGYTRADLDAAPLDWRRMTAPEYLPGVQAVMKLIEAAGRVEPYEKEFIRKDSTRVPVLVGKAFLGGPEGRFVAFVLDLTERKRAEDALRKSEDQLRLVTDSLPVLVGYVDRAGILRFANRHYEDWFGIPVPQMTGRPLRELIGEEAYAHRLRYIETVWRGETARFHGPLPHRDGSVRETELTYIPDVDPAGNVRGFVGLIADVTVQRRTEATLRRYADLFQHAELGLVVTGRDGVTLEMANPAFARMCGHATPEELAGRSVLDAFAPEFRTEVPSHFRIARERGHHTFESTFHRPRDGSRFPVELDVTAVRSGDGGGEVIYYIVSATDITERERTEAELRYQLHLTNTITANAADALFLLDAEARVTFMNPAAEARFGWSEAEVLGRPLYEVVRPTGGGGGEGPLGEAFRSGQTSRDHEDVFHCKDGATVNVLCTNAPIMTGDMVTGSVLVAHDITERKAAEQERERLLAAEKTARTEAETLARQAADANRSKDEFLATLSHELRTPLNAMLGWAQLLRMGGLNDEEFGQGLETIERNARAQAQLVEDLLDLSRIISGKLRLEIGPTDLPAVIEAALDSVRPAAEAKGIRVIPVIDTHAGAIRGDANRLQQVVWNLLSNAIKFTPREGQVQIVLTSVNGQAEVSVSDTGEGIAPQFLPHVFDRLRQGDASITRKHGGLGLGLSIVRHLVELHGGTVSADSPGEGRGATFTVRLPASAPDRTGSGFGAGESGDDAVPAELSPNNPDRPRPAMPSLRGVRALVVDDEPDARDLVARILRQCGAEVSLAASAQEAAEALVAQRPDVLLSDIGMPEEDGYSLIRRVRALPDDQGGRTPAVALTAFARHDDRTRALAEGFQVHIAKPFEAADLCDVVADLVARSRNGDARDPAAADTPATGQP